MIASLSGPQKAALYKENHPFLLEHADLICNGKIEAINKLEEAGSRFTIF